MPSRRAVLRVAAIVIAFPCVVGLVGTSGCSSGAIVSDFTISLAIDNTVLTPGQSTTATATVTWTDTGETAAGMLVNFDSSSPGVATVSPSSRMTGDTGRAQATILAVSDGFATIRAGVGTARSRQMIVTVR